MAVTGHPPQPTSQNPALHIIPRQGHPPFILPMSAMKSRFIIAGIPISAKGFLFAVSINERQVGFCRFWGRQVPWFRLPDG